MIVETLKKVEKSKKQIIRHFSRLLLETFSKVFFYDL